MTPPQFFVHIVESPSPEELLDGRTEGTILRSFLEVCGIPHLYNLAVDIDQLGVALSDRVAQGMQILNLQPVLHLSAHGGETGLQLTDQRRTKQSLPWKNVAKLIKPIHQSVQGLGLCVSACYGSSAKRMAEVLSKDDLPFLWTIGADSKADIQDLALAFSVFYRRLQTGNLDRIAEVMTGAAGGVQFEVSFADSIQQEYRQNCNDALRRLLQLKKTPLQGLLDSQGDCATLGNLGGLFGLAQ